MSTQTHEDIAEGLRRIKWFIGHCAKDGEPLPAHVEVLDDLVHDAKSREGSTLNNDGTDAQVEYLLADGVGWDEILNALTNVTPPEVFGKRKVAASAYTRLVDAVQAAGADWDEARMLAEACRYIEGDDVRSGEAFEVWVARRIDRDESAAGTYTVAVYYRGDDGAWKHHDNWIGVARNAGYARRQALDSLEDARIDGWKAEVIAFQPAEEADEDGADDEEEVDETAG